MSLRFPCPPRRRSALACLLSTIVVTMFALAPAQRALAAPPSDGVPPGWTIIEEDIIVPDSFLDDPGRSSYGGTLWPGGVVPYAFHANTNATMQGQARDAMDEWEARADVTFIPRTTQSNYLLIQNSTGNSSYVGMVGGSQAVNIYNWTYRYIICHELAHAMGFWHEQSRADRDDYIVINYDNIIPGYEGNFDIRPFGGDHGEYDFESVMHYSRCAFTECGSCSTACETISTKPEYGDKQSIIGNRGYISEGDARALGFRYGFTGTDCNDNHVRDSYEIDEGLVEDCNNNDIPDDCETDCNGNGVPDLCDIQESGALDGNGNGVLDACEGVPSILRVKAGATGSNNGTSWNNAFTSLQSALTVARNAPGSVDEIWVAAGTYKPGASRSDSFKLINGVAIYGGFAGNETSLSQRDWIDNATILSGDLSGNDAANFANRTDNSYNVVLAETFVDETAILDGFTIRGGNASNTYVPSQTRHAGGGMYIDESTPTIRRCTFTDNRTGASGGGGAIYIDDSSPRIISCRFDGNSSESGGGIYCYTGYPRVINCVFYANEARTWHGGGMVSVAGGPKLLNCTFASNTAVGGGAKGGGYAHWSGGLTPAGASTMRNCILWSNTDSTGGNMSGQIGLDGGTYAIDYCCIKNYNGAYGSSGTLTGNPQFEDLAGGDLRLSAASPCIDAGSHEMLISDADDLNFDDDVDELTPLDCLDADRFFDVPEVVNTGDADGTGLAMIDIGAYEVGEEVDEAPCPADVLPEPNGDGNVTVTDLLAFIIAFDQPCGSCPEDIAPQPDGDGVVSIADIQAAVAAFGACE